MFWSCHSHFTVSPVVSSLSRVYSDNTTGDFSLDVLSGDVKGGVSPRTTHIYSHRDECRLGGVDFLSCLSSNCPDMIN